MMFMSLSTSLWEMEEVGSSISTIWALEVMALAISTTCCCAMDRSFTNAFGLMSPCPSFSRAFTDISW